MTDTARSALAAKDEPARVQALTKAIFTVAGLGPIVLALIALAAARMPRDEIAHPLR